MPMSNAEWYAVVPARAGSRGIPGKNRRIVGGRSLVERAMDRAALITGGNLDHIIVTTDDPFVADLAEYRGLTLVERPIALAGPEATIAETVQQALRAALVPLGASVAVCQPTSPTLDDVTVLEALSEFAVHTDWDSLATVVNDPHLMWSETPRGITPLFTARINRQYRDESVWRETGGLMLVRSWNGPESLVTDQHHLFPVAADEAVDIDTPLDLITADAALHRRILEWRIIAGQTVGYGHLYRCLAIADELPLHEHRFIVDGPEAARALVDSRYPALPYGVEYEAPADAVIFDNLVILPADYDRAREMRAFIIGIELEAMPRQAFLDLYVNELGCRYPDEIMAQARHVRQGPAFGTLRAEFRAARTALETGAVASMTDSQRILVTFGGEDPTQMTARILKALGPDYQVRAVIGPGFSPSYANQLRTRYPHHEILEAETVSMSREMLEAHTVITGAGRTAWEAASLGCALVTIPVNGRERTHEVPRFARRIPRPDLTDDAIRLLTQAAMSDDSGLEARRIRANDSGMDGLGSKRTGWLIDGLIQGML